jgi:hypothetical protein
MTQGDTLVLSVLGVKADGGKISLSPDSLSFAATGSATVDAGGVLTVAGTGAGSVTAGLGALKSNTLQISAVSVNPAPPSGGGAGGSAATSASGAHGYVISTPDG